MSDEIKIAAGFTCPVPIAARDTVLLGHGSGGKMSADLLRGLLLPALQNPILARQDDQAIVEINGVRLAFTTDSFVVKPLFFPGGDIGSLAVNGTVNDLAMGGAEPLFLSLAFILEEGLPMDVLRRVTESVSEAAARAGVQIVTGDTKVVEKGGGDELFVNTSGIGRVPDGVRLSANQARPGRLRASQRHDWRSWNHDSFDPRGARIRKPDRKRYRRASRSGGRHAARVHAKSAAFAIRLAEDFRVR